MRPYQSLLLIANPAMRHGLAIKRAAELAISSGATLHMAVFEKSPAVLPFIAEEIQDSANSCYFDTLNDWLREEAQLQRSRGIVVSTEVVSSDELVKTILDHVEHSRPDMLIKDTQHENVLKRTFITPLDWHLLRQCPVPVHLIGSAGHARPELVIAAVDAASPDAMRDGLNARIIEQAQRLAGHTSAQVHLVHVLDLSSLYFGDSTGSALNWTDRWSHVHAEVEKTFQQLADQHGITADHCHLQDGSPLQLLPELAEHLRADVVVMGRVHRSGLSKLVGSTTEHLLYRSPCSILAV